MKYYPYYSRAYDAVLGGFLGEYQLEIPDSDGRMSWKKAYGLKAFSPLAEGFYYSDFDDFGQNRSYGYSRQHLGHDLLTSSGTPVISVESGIVEAMGWNQYGGWRLGIRSFGQKRYYYYAHLQKDHPCRRALHRRCSESRRYPGIHRTDRLQPQREYKQYRHSSSPFRDAARIR